MSLGSVMIDIEGLTLTEEDKALLTRPATGGIILFARNYESRAQLQALTQEIHALRDPHLLIAVDQEGGRVQRFRDEFCRLPAMGRLGRLYDEAPAQANQFAENIAWLMASELRSAGVDFSFAPVLDLDCGISQVIGDRGFHRQSVVVAELANAWMRGMHLAGMAAVGKHFPGHGFVKEDSHAELPVDTRRFEDILMEDLIPFERLINNGLEAIMPAHVVYEQTDTKPAGFSSFWLKEILRQQLNFQGVIFSDDLNMSAADATGSFTERAQAALSAGCDIILVCNNREGAVEVLDSLADNDDPASHLRVMRMHGKKQITHSEIQLDPRWTSAMSALAELDGQFELSLDF